MNTYDTRELIIATTERRIDDVKHLINAGANVNFKDPWGRTAVMYAIQSNSFGIFKLLLDAGANVDLHDHNGWTPLIWAVNETDNKDIINMIIAAGTNVNYASWCGMTALMCASAGSEPNIVRLLIDAGANIHCQDNDGRTALMIAVTHSSLSSDTVSILLNAGANTTINIKNRSYGDTALMLAAKWPNSTSSENTIKLLLEAGAYYNTTTLFKYAHKDKRKVLYDCILLPHKITFCLGYRDSGSIISYLPKEIVQVILNYIAF